MRLINFQKVRIKKYTEGYLVEKLVEKTTFKKSHWTHLIGFSGMNDKPFYYSSFKMALSELLKFFEWSVLVESNVNEEINVEKRICFEISYMNKDTCIGGSCIIDLPYKLSNPKNVEDAFYKIYNIGTYRFLNYQFKSDIIKLN